MKAELYIWGIYEEDQKIFNESNFFVEAFGRKLTGLAEHIWIKDMALFIHLVEHFRTHGRPLTINIRAKFDSSEEPQISHMITMFPGFKISEREGDLIDTQINPYFKPSVLKDHGGYAPVIIIEELKLRSKIAVREGKINEIAYCEIISTCLMIETLIRQGASLENPELIGFNFDGNPVALLKSKELAPPVELDESMVLYEPNLKDLFYYPAGIPAFKDLASISSFSRMRDSLVPTRSPLWILEKSWIEKLRKLGCRPKTIPVMESGTELRKKYINMLVSIKDLVASLPGSRLSVADL